MGIYFGKATGIYFRTLPFVLLRIAVGILFGLLAIVYFGAVVWVLFTMRDGGSISDGVAFIGLLVAGVLFLLFVRVVRKYVLYLVSAGHIAVIAHIVDTGEVPSNQLRYGLGQVKDNFASASSLFAVDLLVKSIVKQFNRAMISLQGLVGFVPALKNIITILRRAVSLAASYIDEAIMAHIFVSDEENNWRAARDGVVLYGKCWKPVLTATILIVLALYVVAFVALLALTPLASVLGDLSPTYEIVGWIAIAGIALTLYIGFLRPWVKTVVITTFLIESRELTPDSQAMEYVESRSSKFSELVAKASAGEAEEPEPTPTERGPEPAE